jgi:malate synthase
MEDAATAEISRTSIWQWIKNNKSLDNGKLITVELFRTLLQEEMVTIEEEVGSERFASGQFAEAAKIMDRFTTSDELVDFLTVPAYDYL